MKTALYGHTNQETAYVVADYQMWKRIVEFCERSEATHE